MVKCLPVKLAREAVDREVARAVLIADRFEGVFDDEASGRVRVDAEDIV